MLSHESDPCPMCGTKGWVTKHTPSGEQSTGCPRCGGYGRIAKPGTPDPRARDSVRVPAGQQPSIIIGDATPQGQANLAPKAVQADPNAILNEAASNLAKNLGIPIEQAVSALTKQATAPTSVFEAGARAPIESPGAPVDLDSLKDAPVVEMPKEPEPDAPAPRELVTELEDIPIDPHDKDAIQSYDELDEDDEPEASEDEDDSPWPPTQ